ncbi:Peptidoglycan O-acetyltransferase [Stieleria bergensis]|uniref:Peptidoglycan O-acetyltransferase n=1 Tax=Stieleria bergensis TaxID=2528025 RepID=A0A517SS91_9BACT|nr:Peptidoglycan O-acetyltransferase [Planctomycetes bacterium SV_7m_r]
MIFTQLEFLLFLGVILAATWACRSLRQRHALLLVASYYFYAYWDARFCGLLLFSTVVDYVAARRIASAKGAGKRWWLGISLGSNLGLLGFFKYCNFFVESAAELLGPLGLSTGTLNIILPVGISFYTFQTLSYTLDVFRGKLKPERNFVTFALYVAFFPQLVAGPIVRASELLPQFSRMPTRSGRRFYSGSQCVLRGLVKKVLLADRLGEFVDIVFAGPELYDSTTLWLATLAYAGQIYYDFSGYTDIAIGVAKMLGYRFPRNFRHPYLATSPAQFWHRWHMTLSRWLRDYLYIPLGGSRCGALRTQFNLTLTMFLGGLWHGAAWHFAFWGLWHGMALSLGRAGAWFRKKQERQAAASETKSLPAILFTRVIGWLLTMLVVSLGWVLFRATSLDQALQMLLRMVAGGDGIHWMPPLVLGVLALMVVEHLVWATRWRRAMRLPIDQWYSPVATTLLIGALILYAPRGFSPFVYFQF